MYSKKYKINNKLFKEFRFPNLKEIKKTAVSYTT